jgi:hypothetical protein
VVSAIYTRYQVHADKSHPGDCLSFLQPTLFLSAAVQIKAITSDYTFASTPIPFTGKSVFNPIV